MIILTKILKPKNLTNTKPKKLKEIIKKAIKRTKRKL